jgi:hypothetical protein
MTTDLVTNSVLNLEDERHALITKMEKTDLPLNIEKDSLLSNIKQNKILSDLDDIPANYWEDEDLGYWKILIFKYPPYPPSFQLLNSSPTI